MAFAGTAPIVSPWTGRDIQLADSGAAYSTMNTPGTPISGHAAATTFDQTKALLYIFNNGTLTIYPSQLRLQLTTAGTNSTTMRFEQVIDKGPTRYTSGGTSLTLNGTNITTGPTSKAQAYFGAVVVATNTASSRTVADGLYRNVIGVVGDTYNFTWGAPTGGPQSNVTTIGVAVANVSINYPPVAINPNEIFAIHQWSPSQTVACQFEFQFDWFEK